MQFCGKRPVLAWFEGLDFKVYVDAAEQVRGEEAWCACSTCRSLVLADTERHSSGTEEPRRCDGRSEDR